MTIDISRLEQLKQLPFNRDNDNLIRVLCEIMEEVVDTTNTLIAELPSEITITQPSWTNTLKEIITKDDETTVARNTVTITQS